MQKSTIWITGASGKIGRALVQRLKRKTDYKVIATDLDVDITDMKEVERSLDIYRPNIVINCASVSDAAFCEENHVQAYKVNALGARNLASATRQHNAKLIHLSTDDVFCGISNRSKNEFDIPTPETVYGKSKFAGENYVRELNPKHLIIRSSWVYGEDGKDYLGEVLEKGKRGEHFTAPMDRISTPTSTRVLVDFIEELINRREYGIFHAACEGACSRLDYARTVLTLAGLDPMLAEGTFSGDNGSVVSTLLDNLMMKMTGIYEMPQWQDELTRFMKDR